MKSPILAMTLSLSALSAPVIPAVACTGLTLKSADGAIVPARTVEWAGSQYVSYCVVTPRGYQQQAYTHEGENGMTFKARYGYAGIACAMPQFIVDGVNEKGLCAELFFFPGAGGYPEYDSAKLNVTIGDMQLVSYLLGQCATVDEAKEAIGKVRVTALEPSGQTCHWRLTDLSGKQIVVEIVDGETHFYDCIGVLTNSPGYEWHLTNLRNYINLYPGAAPDRDFLGLKETPISGGSGLLGLPGDFTSPSRFVRVAFYQYTARQQPTAFATVCQAFQILNNFDIPVGTAWHMEEQTPDMLSATQWTVVNDITNKVIYYHTGVDGTIRAIDLKDIDFGKIKYTTRPVDDVTAQPVKKLIFN